MKKMVPSSIVERTARSITVIEMSRKCTTPFKMMHWENTQCGTKNSWIYINTMNSFYC